MSRILAFLALPLIIIAAASNAFAQSVYNTDGYADLLRRQKQTKKYQPVDANDFGSEATTQQKQRPTGITVNKSRARAKPGYKSNSGTVRPQGNDIYGIPASYFTNGNSQR